MTQNITAAAFERLKEDLLGHVDTRSRDIVQRRFGLKTGATETLESIGKSYGITRERVRQIESQAKKALVSHVGMLEQAAALLARLFEEEGGIIPAQRLVSLLDERLGSGTTESTITFYLELLPDYEYVTVDSLFVPHWRRTAAVGQQAERVLQTGQEILQKSGHPLPEDEFLTDVRARVSGELNTRKLFAWLFASKNLHKNPFGQWGLAGWSEITPRGVGDKAYAVLRQHGRPAHFREITNLINQAHFDHKVANPQTVHNELIKDKRFVLVGRGLYGLTQWGYLPGTVADVLESILRKARKPLSREELIEQVLGQRLVKKNTILLSLQDHSRFVKTAENRYTLRE